MIKLFALGPFALLITKENYKEGETTLESQSYVDRRKRLNK